MKSTIAKTTCNIRTSVARKQQTFRGFGSSSGGSSAMILDTLAPASWFLNLV